MDLAELKDWTSIISGALAAAAIVYTWVTSRSQQNSSRVKALEEIVADHAKALDRIEIELKHLPTADELTDLKLNIGDMSGEVKALRATITPLTESIRRLDDYLHGKQT